MSSCGQRTETRRLVRLREEDRISRAEGRKLLLHVAACAACRHEAAARAPELLFAVAEADRPEVSKDDASRLASDVVSALEVGRVRARLGASPGRRRLLLLAASIALAAVGGALYVRSRGAEAIPVARVDRAGSAAASRPETALPASPARPILEGVASPGATIYEFAAVSREEPAVVFVVDRNADL